MKEYVDEKFWRMFSGFITLIAVSLVLLIIIKAYKNKEVIVNNSDTQASVVLFNRNK